MIRIGVEWSGVEWSEVEWSGMEWNGVCVGKTLGYQRLTSHGTLFLSRSHL